MNKASDQHWLDLCDYIEQKESSCFFNYGNCDFDTSQYGNQRDYRDNYWGLSECERELLEMEGE